VEKTYKKYYAITCRLGTLKLKMNIVICLNHEIQEFGIEFVIVLNFGIILIATIYSKIFGVQI
jgi:hypothetical protein